MSRCFDHDLVGVRFALIKFLRHPKAELDIAESRQVILLMRLLLETLPTLLLVSPYVALPLFRVILPTRVKHHLSRFHSRTAPTYVSDSRPFSNRPNDVSPDLDEIKFYASFTSSPRRIVPP